MRGSRMFFQIGFNFDGFLGCFFLVDEGIGGAIIGLPAKPHLNGV